MTDPTRPPLDQTAVRTASISVLALCLAISVVRWVTMRTVYVEWDRPSYGFPLPAFGASGVSSGMHWVALLPLLVDLCVAMFVLAPPLFVLLRRMSPPLVLAGAAATGVGTALSLAPTAFLAVLGVVQVDLYANSDWPVECRTLWIGPTEDFLDWTDDDDHCVMRATARLEGDRGTP